MSKVEKKPISGVSKDEKGCEIYPMYMSERFYEESFDDLLATLGMEHFRREDKEAEG